jgi:general secretion pathway protein G
MLRLSRWKSSAAGFTFIELVIATFVMMILATAALPIARVSMKRQREKELRATLREIRTAIDRFKDNADRQVISAEFGSEGYPPSLEVLVEGVPLNNDVTGRKLKLLRRIPIDPLTGQADWGMRSYQDPTDAKAWGGQNVYDVYSKSDGIALDGSKYRDW